MESQKQDALEEMFHIAESNGITLNEINVFFRSAKQSHADASGIAAKIFGLLGGLLVFGGVSVFIHMQWDALGSLGRVLVTLPPGFLAFALGVYFAGHNTLKRAATPLFLLAAAIEPVGIVVALKEYGHGEDASQTVFFTCFVMLLQQGLTFWARQRTVLALTTLFFGLSLVTTYLEIHHMPDKYIGLIVGGSELCLAYGLDRSRHRTIAPINYFFGSIIFLCAYGDLVSTTPYELTFLGCACLFIYASILARSRSLLGVSAVAMLSFIGYYSSEHFAHVIGWPITLILAGLVMIAMGGAAVKLSNRFMSGRA